MHVCFGSSSLQLSIRAHQKNAGCGCPSVSYACSSIYSTPRGGSGLLIWSVLTAKYTVHSSKVHLKPKVAHNEPILIIFGESRVSKNTFFSTFRCPDAAKTNKWVQTLRHTALHVLTQYLGTFLNNAKLNRGQVGSVNWLEESVSAEMCPTSLQATYRSRGALALHASRPNRRRIQWI